jgi:hypothetical protein
MRVWVGLVVLAAGCDKAFVPKDREPADTGCDDATWYADLDGDGAGDAASASCGPGPGLVTSAGDCDDRDAGVNPAGVESCDGVDQDCDGSIDEGAGANWFRDGDGDGWGNSAVTTASCSQPSGYVDVDGDCADGDSSVHPGQDELCNGIDDDCDDIVDLDAVSGTSTWWRDADFDGFGDPAVSIEACDPPAGYTDVVGDCDDSTAGSFPGATDGCNGFDDDCDGSLDEDALADWFLMTVESISGDVLRVETADAATSTVSVLSTATDINSTDVREDGLSIAHDYVRLELWEVDACSGAATLLGPTGFGRICGVAFGETGLLYGIDPDADTLVEMDVDHWSFRTVGPLGINVTRCGLAYDCTHDRLIGLSSDTGELFTVDPKSGATSDFVPTGFAEVIGVGLEFDPKSALVYASTGSSMYSIEPASGVTTFIGTIASGTAIDDLSLHPPCSP